MKEASQTVSLLDANGDIQAINTGSPTVHTYLPNVLRVEGGKGKIPLHDCEGGF